MQRVLFVLAIGILVGCSTSGSTPTPDLVAPQLKQALNGYEIALERFYVPSIWPADSGQPGATMSRQAFGKNLDDLDTAALLLEGIPLSPRWEKLTPKVSALSEATIAWTRTMWSCDAARDYFCEDESPLWDTLTARYGDLVSTFGGQ